MPDNQSSGDPNKTSSNNAREKDAASTTPGPAVQLSDLQNILSNMAGKRF